MSRFKVQVIIKDGKLSIDKRRSRCIHHANTANLIKNVILLSRNESGVLKINICQKEMQMTENFHNG